jgi:hypothetical protein
MTARKQFLLRIDPEVWADVEKWAADELRSVNAQVEYLLREAVRRRPPRQMPDQAETPRHTVQTQTRSRPSCLAA